MTGLFSLVEYFLNSDWSEHVGWVLLHSIWQIALLAAVYALISYWLSKGSANVRYLIGCSFMLLMLLLPMITYGVLPATSTNAQSSERLLVEDQPSHSRAIPTITGDQPSIEPPALVLTDLVEPQQPMAVSSSEEPALTDVVAFGIRDWLPAATLIWLLGVFVLSMRPLIGWLHVKKLCKTGLTPLSESLQISCSQLKDTLGVRQIVRFAQSSMVEVPTVIGYVRPVVLIPLSTVTGLSSSELELIVAHELAHIRRHDYLVNVLQTVIEALLFFHPAMWWLSLQVRRERENCCDDVAVSISGDRATYVRALAQLEQNRAPTPAMAANGGSLLLRVRRLLGQPNHEFGYRNTTTWLAGLLAIALVSATFVYSDMALGRAGEGTDGVAASEAANDENDDKESTSASDTEAEPIGSDNPGGLVVGLSQRPPAVWTVKSLPKLMPNIIEPGSRRLMLSTVQMPESRLEIDGVLYRHVGEDLIGVAYHSTTFWTDEGKGLGPKVVLHDKWRSLEDDEPLKLKAGKHRVRYGWAGFHPSKEDPRQPDRNRPVVLWSGETKIEVSATKGADLGINWGEAVDGLQAGIAVSNRDIPCRIGQEVPLQFLVRNISDQPISFTQPRVPVFINWSNYRSKPGTQLFGPQNQVFPASGVGGIGLPGQIKWIVQPGQVISMATIRLPLRAEGWKGTTVNVLTYCVKPGKHQVSLSHSINGKAITSGNLSLDVQPRDPLAAPVGASWGEPSEGIRCRLHSSEREIRHGQPLILLVDLQNRGSETLQQNWHSLEFKLEIDGKWTGQLAPLDVSGPVNPLSPGDEWINIPLVLDEGQYSMTKTTSDPGGEVDFSKLLEAGRHKIRIDVYGVISQPIEVEVLATSEHSPDGDSQIHTNEASDVSFSREDLFDRAARELDPERIESFRRNISDLGMARLYDAERNGGIYLQDGQKVAEHYYLAYLPRSKNSAERCEIYTQLGILFTTNYSRKHGEEPDFPKARKYLAKALEAEPTRIGNCTIRARLHSLGPDLSSDDMFAKRLAIYKWLNSWNEKSIRENWLPLRYQVGREEHYFPSFLRYWESVKSSETTNIVGLAREDSVKLRKIIREVPGTEAAIRSQAKLNDLASQQLVGHWIGGGGILPVHHQFSANGSYERRVANEQAERGSWSMDGERLVRKLGGKEQSSKIMWTNPDAFRVEQPNGNSSGYNRVDEKSGKVILWGDPTDGVQVRIHSPDVRLDQSQRIVLLKTDLYSNKPRILPHYGAPIDKYAIQWDGKWYCEIDRSANVAASVGPSLARQRSSMHTRITAKRWVEEATGKPMPALSPGKHTLRIGYPLIDSPEVEGGRPLRAISNPLEIKIVDENPIKREISATSRRLRWDRLSPDNEHARVMRDWDKIPYEKARTIGIASTEELPDLWEAVPVDSKSYELRDEVKAFNVSLDATIYHRPDQGRFWVQRDPAASSWQTWFGPFDGNPYVVLGIHTDETNSSNETASRDITDLDTIPQPGQYLMGTIFGEKSKDSRIKVQLGRIIGKGGTATLVALQPPLSDINITGKTLRELIPLVRDRYQQGYQLPQQPSVSLWIRTSPNKVPKQVQTSGIPGLSSQLQRVSPTGPIRIGDTLHFNLVVTNDTDKPIQFDWITGSMWQAVVDEQARQIKLMGMFAGSGHAEQQQVVIPPKKQKVLHHIRHRVLAKDSTDSSLPFPLHVSRGEYEVSAAGVWGKTPLVRLAIQPKARLQFRMQMPKNAKPREDQADRVGWIDDQGQQQTLVLYREIYLDEDDVQDAKVVTNEGDGQIEVTFTKHGAERMRAITEPAVADGRRLVVLLDDQVIAAPKVRAVVSDKASLTGLKAQQAKNIHQAIQSTLNNPSPSDKGETKSSSRANESSKAKTVRLIISKDRGGQVSPGGITYNFENELTGLDRLQARIKQERENSPNLNLIIHADPELPYSRVVVAMQLAQAAGVKEVAFATGNETPKVESVENADDEKLLPGSPLSRKAMLTGPDGRGLAGVEVKAYVHRKQEPVLETVTDDQGYFLLPNSPPGEELSGYEGILRGYYLNVSKAGYIPWKPVLFVGLDKDGKYSRHNFLMRKATTVAGKLLGTDGKPLPGAQIRLETIVATPDQHLHSGYPWQITKSDGSFRFEQVLPGKHLVQFHRLVYEGRIIEPSGRMAAVVVETSDAKGGDLAVEDVLLDLSQSTASLEVTVLDEHGNPAPDKKVELSWRPLVGKWGGGQYNRHLRSDSYPEVITDSKGKAQITGVPPGTWEVRVAWIKDNILKTNSTQLNFMPGANKSVTLAIPKPTPLLDMRMNNNIALPESKAVVSSISIEDSPLLIDQTIPTNLDGGTLSFVVALSGNKRVTACFDYRKAELVQQATWKVVGNKTLGRLFVGSENPETAEIVPFGSELEKQILQKLNQFVDEQLSSELQAQFVTPVRNSRFYKRMRDQTGKKPEELRRLSALLAKLRHYERVFVRSHGVDVRILGDVDLQWQPSETPTYAISAINHSENDKLVLGRTQQAFELEVDGKWYRWQRVHFRSSPLPPGRIYDDFPLTLDKNWLCENAPLKLSAGRHMIRIRCRVHPFPSDSDSYVATSSFMPVWISAPADIEE